MSLIRNERIKYLATALNGIAVASVTAGFIAPLAAAIFGLPGPHGQIPVVLFSVIWLSVGIALHLIVQGILGRLKE